jgi:hypothetical protein
MKNEIKVFQSSSYINLMLLDSLFEERRDYCFGTLAFWAKSEYPQFEFY